MKTGLTGILAALGVCALVSTSLQAAGNLMVTPTRVVFDERDRSAQVTLVNQGNQSGNFRISFIRQNMTENGEFLPVEDGEAGNFSDTMIRYSPRQVTLPPGQSQVVRLALRRPADLADGEYRSHMLFQSLPDSSSSSVEKITQDSGTGISIELVPIVGISIPVIVRQGELQSQVTLSDPDIVPAKGAGGGEAIAVSINRSGTGSTYGDLRAVYTPDGGAPIVIAQANKIAVYANMRSRRFKLPLNQVGDVELQGGSIELLFLEPDTDDDSSVLARTQLTLN